MYLNLISTKIKCLITQKVNEAISALSEFQIRTIAPVMYDIDLVVFVPTWSLPAMETFAC